MLAAHPHLPAVPRDCADQCQAKPGTSTSRPMAANVVEIIAAAAQ
jgi:hypothetical protein